MPSGNCKRTFDLEWRTVQKITFCLYVWKPVQPENFSFSVPFSIITHEHSKKVRFSTSYEHKEGGSNKKLGGRMVKSWPNVASRHLQWRKKVQEKVRDIAWKAKNFPSLLETGSSWPEICDRFMIWPWPAYANPHLSRTSRTSTCTHRQLSSCLWAVKKKKWGVSLPGSRPWSDFFFWICFSI